MPEILVTKKVPIAEDGIHVLVYEPKKPKNTPISVSDRTAKLIMDCGAGELYQEKVEEVVVETKAISSAPENAMVKEDKKEVKEELVIEVCNLADELNVTSKKVISNAAVIGMMDLKPITKLTAKQVEQIKAKLGK